MNDIYIKNINSLKNRGFIFEQIDNYANNYSVEDCKNGEKTIKISYNDKNIYLHSKYNPLNEAQKFLEKNPFNQDNIIVCFGFGFGYYAKEFLKGFSDKNLIFVYEPSEEIFDLAIKNIDFTDIFEDKRFFIYAGNDILKFKSLITYAVSHVRFRNIMLVSIPHYDDIYIENYKEFLQSLKENIINKSVDANTLFYYAEDWTKNLIGNIGNIFESYNIADFYMKFKDKPIIIVAAGPSLNKNVELLKKIKDKVLIICVFVAAKVLYKNGIIPDIIVSVVSNQTGMFEAIENVPFAYIPTLPPELLNQHKGNKIVCSNLVESYTLKLLASYNKPISVIATGGSVACIAVDIAAKLGGTPIILIGQDLAYTDSKYHAEGTDHLIKSMDEVGFKKLEVDDVFGNKVVTDEVMYSYIVWFESYVSHNSNILFIDATEGGAFIKGTKVMTLQQVIDEYGNTDISVNQVMENIYKNGKILSEDEKKAALNDFFEACDYMDELLEELDNGIELSEKLVKTCKYSSNGSKQINKMIQKLNDIDKKFNNLGISKNILSFIMDKINYELNSFYFDKDETLDIANKNLLFYKTMKSSIENIIPYFKSEKDKLKQLYKI